ncbi:MAG: DUF2849 domain-containing protein [Terricaulis sp.]
MKIVTAHILQTGEVVYWAANGAWAKRIEDAAPISDELADDALAIARSQPTIVTNAYLVGVEAPGRPSPREFLRETIRANGPSVRRDLGKQAEGGQ